MTGLGCGFLSSASCFVGAAAQLLLEAGLLFRNRPVSLNALAWKRQFRKKTLYATRSGGGACTSAPRFDARKTDWRLVGMRDGRCCRAVLIVV